MSKRVTNYNKTFLPAVRLPRDGSACKHERHFKKCAKQVIKKLQWQADRDIPAERFVFTSVGRLVETCINYDVKPTKSYGYRMVRDVLDFLLEKKIITEDEKMRLGGLRKGWVVASHADMVKIQSKMCVFCELANAGKSQQTVAGASAETSLPTSHPTSGILEKTSHSTSDLTSCENPKNFTSDFTSDFTSESAENKVNADDSGNDAGEMHGVVQDGAHAVCQGKALMPIYASDALVSDSPKTNGAKPVSLSALTVTQRLGQDPKLEHMLEFLSDGEFEIGALVKYDYTDALRDACSWVLQRAENHIVRDRAQCKVLMENVNDTLRYRIPPTDPPRGWIPVMKRLKEGGALVAQIHTERRAFCNYCGVPLEFVNNKTCNDCWMAGKR